MPLTVQHVKTSLIADGADTSLVRPSDWNSSHAVTFSPDASEVIKVISAGAGSVSSGSVVFANSNGVTFGMNAGTITASVPVVGGAQTGISGLSAGTTLATSGTVSFGNSNGISFGMNGNTLTASYTVPSVPAQTAFVLSNSNNVSFGTNGSTVTATATFSQTVQTQNMVSVLGSTGNISFQNGNGVSFGGNGSTVTASVAAQTVDTRKAGTGFSSTGLNIGLSGTLNTDGFSLSATVPNVPAQSVQPVAISGSNGSFAFSTVTFGNSNGASFYTTNGSVVVSYTVPNVPAQTAQTLGLYAASNTTGQSSSSTVDARSLSFQGVGVASVGYSNGSVVVSVPAGGGGGDGYNQAGFTNSTANSTMALVWAGNSNGSGNVTMGLTGSTVTMSAPAGGGGGGGAALSAGTQSASTGTVAFANSNGISFGMSGSSQITASYTVPTIPGATVFSNSNNVSFGLNGSTITATATWPAQTVQPAVEQLNGSSGTLSLAVGSSLSASTNGSTVTFGLASNITTALQSAGAYLTTARASNDAIGLNTALTANGLSVTANSSGLSINVPAWLTTAAQVSHSHGNPTLALTNINGTTNSASNGLTLSLSAVVPAQTQDPINLYATGNTTQSSQGTGNVSALSFRGEGIASVGVSGNSVVISVPSGGGGGDGVNIVQLGTTNTTGTSWSSSSAVIGLNGSGGIVISQNNSNQLVVSYSGTGDVEGFSLLGNVAGNSTVAPVGNMIYLSGGNNVTLSGTGNTIVVSAGAGGGGSPISMYIPSLQASSTQQRMYAAGCTFNNIEFHPFTVVEPIAFNEVRIHGSQLITTASNRGGGSYSLRYGIYSKNGDDLSLISGSSLSWCYTFDSVSATLSYPATTATSGYAYGTTTATATAQMHSVMGSVGLRHTGMQFGNTMSLSPGVYWLGINWGNEASGGGYWLHQECGNIAIQHVSQVPLGVNYSQISSAPYYGRMTMGLGTQTTFTNFLGTTTPPSYPVSLIQNTLSFIPYMVFEMT